MADIEQRKLKIVENTQVIEFTKDKIKEALIESNNHKINHGEESQFHKYRKEDLRKHQLEMAGLKKKAADTTLLVSSPYLNLII